MAEYLQNKPSICYYVPLQQYTQGKFGNTDFNPPLSQPIEKRKVTYIMPTYDTITKPRDQCSHNTSNDITYSYFGYAYNKPDCSVCSKNDCK